MQKSNKILNDCIKTCFLHIKIIVCLNLQIGVRIILCLSKDIIALFNKSFFVNNQQIKQAKSLVKSFFRKIKFRNMMIFPKNQSLVQKQVKDLNISRNFKQSINSIQLLIFHNRRFIFVLLYSVFLYLVFLHH